MTPEFWISLVTLTFMEIVLGIDNIVFISIVAGKLPEHQQDRARNIGLILALAFRVVMILSIAWIVAMKNPIIEFEIFSYAFSFSWRDIILIIGGLFLLGKSVSEMHHKLEGQTEEQEGGKHATMGRVIFQIILLDIVFSFDSILTAVGLVDHVSIMITAVVISMIIMMVFAKSISDFINARPTMKILALSFLLLIGFMLVLEGFHKHVDKGYIYFAMLFSFIIELMNQRIRKDVKPVELRARLKDEVED